jgi:hypothetical protein
MNKHEEADYDLSESDWAALEETHIRGILKRIAANDDEMKRPIIDRKQLSELHEWIDSRFIVVPTLKDQQRVYDAMEKQAPTKGGTR